MRPMLLSVIVAAGLTSACATAPLVEKRNSFAQVTPSERDQAFSRALSTAQSRGWIIAVSDRAAGLLTTQQMNTGVKSCGLLSCPSRSTLQITIAETGDITVNLHRELLFSDRWFVPSYEPNVREIEAEQDDILRAIIGTRATATQ
jgi:hypothetical protein